MFSLTSAFFVWIQYSPANIIDNHPVPLLVAAGIFFPACVERMVLARLTKDAVPYVYPFTLPVFIGVAQAAFVGNPEYDVRLIQAAAVVAIGSYLYFAAIVIHQITDYFDIKAFVINRPLQWPLKSRTKSAAAPAKKKARASPSPKKKRSASPKKAAPKKAAPPSPQAHRPVTRSRSRSRRRK